MQKYAIRWLGLMTVLWLPMVANANTPAEQLSRLLGELHSMQAQFNQTIYDASGGSISRSKGRVSLERPGKFRWDTVTPTKQSIIADGQKIWIYDPDLEQVTVQAMKSNLADSPAFLLTGSDTALMNSFTIAEAKAKRNKGTWFRLIPKDKNAMFNWVELGFHNKTLYQMRLQDGLGQQTIIQFNQVKYNQPIPSQRFNFKPPKGVDVISDSNM